MIFWCPMASATPRRRQTYWLSGTSARTLPHQRTVDVLEVAHQRAERGALDERETRRPILVVAVHPVSERPEQALEDPNHASCCPPSKQTAQGGVRPGPLPYRLPCLPGLTAGRARDSSREAVTRALIARIAASRSRIEARQRRAFSDLTAAAPVAEVTEEAGGTAWGTPMPAASAASGCDLGSSPCSQVALILGGRH